MSRGTSKTRTSILEAAWKLLIDEGPGGLKMGRVARDAGVSRQAVYLHFDSRGDVLLSLVEYIDEKLQLGERLGDLPATDDPVEAVCNLLRVTARYAPQIQEVALAFELNRHSDDDIAAAFEDRMEQRRSGLRTALAAVRRSGQLSGAWTVEQAVDVLWALGLPSFYGSLVTDRGWSVDEYEQLLVRTFEQTLVERA